ncbi:NUDIX hydrolase [Solwaraspora sp. WMMB335]|uniref:NUDIX hydrolase n=1 Tax=Solwaraspora sp. WMMB335 TaxID=3404118 RepID=UPI003B93D615
MRRIAAYGICHDPGGRLLLVRSPGDDGGATGRPQLPGGVLRHGEHPADAVIRGFVALAGLTVRSGAVVAVISDTLPDPITGRQVHTDRIIFRVEPSGAGVRADPAGPVGQVEGQLTAQVEGELTTTRERGQRFGAYGVVTDPAGRILLTRIAAGYPGAGRWHLPGGGTDFGEQPLVGLLRELIEETGQAGRARAVLGVRHHHDPAALGPDGRRVDWHVVQAIYRVSVDRPTPAVVTEAAGGSTAAARWFTQDELADRPLSVLATSVLVPELGDQRC